LLYACVVPPSQSNKESHQVTETPQISLCEVKFHLKNIDEIPSGSSLAIDIVDEITGLAINPKRQSLTQIGSNEFESIQNLRCGSVIKYRYVRQGSAPSIEHTTEGLPVRYRIHSIMISTVIEDAISAWDDSPYAGQFGRIEGRITDNQTGSPVGNLLISLQGRQLITSSDGRFRLDHLMPGKHNLTIVHINEDYEPFQQDVEISADSMTPINISVTSREHLDVTFIVKIPADTPEYATVRMVGSTYLLGNSFSDQEGGMSIIPALAPVLKKLEPGVLGITLNLPVDAVIQYKYTLGDGFWNAEHQDNGKFLIRELIVKTVENKIEDSIYSWRSGSLNPVTFSLTAPDLPFDGEHPSLQLNPYGWTEPLPMWSDGNGGWGYILFSPLEILDEVNYRICRNEHCPETVGWNDGEQLTGSFSTPENLPETFDIKIDKWLNPPITLEAYSPEDQSILAKEDFFAGVEITSEYDQHWLPYFNRAVDYIRDLGANWVVLSPTWTASSTNPPVFSLVSGKDPFPIEVEQLSNSIVNKNLQLALFPQLTFEEEDTWWATATLDSGWWDTWFDNYRMFILNNAQLANQTHANALIIGGPGTAPSLPTGKLADGSESRPPADSEIRWRNLLQEIRDIYSGPVFWAAAYPRDIYSIPPFVKELDKIYILWSASASEGNPQVEQEIVPLYDSFGIPIIIGVSPLAEQGFAGCNSSNGYCQISGEGIGNNPAGQVEFNINMLSSINAFDMITGLTSRAFDPSPPILDNSASIYYKSAADVLRFWFTQLRNP